MAVLRGVLSTLLLTVLGAGLGAVLLIGWLATGLWWLVGAVAVVLVVYGVVAAAVQSYDLRRGTGWLALLVDSTWSLPNTVFGAVIGLPLYSIFGTPTTADSQGQNWVSFRPRSSTGFGHDVLQTLGTVNLGGAGQHERMHLLQARIFGPFYLPFFAVSYVVTFLLQVLFTLLLGLLLKWRGLRRAASLQPPARSAVPGFWGWIYYATPFEVWAYASGNP